MPNRISLFGAPENTVANETSLAKDPKDKNTVANGFGTSLAIDPEDKVSDSLALANPFDL